MDQNPQNSALYPHASPPPFPTAHYVFGPPLQRSEDPLPLPPSYHTPSAPCAAAQGFYGTESVQGLEYGKHHEAREAHNATTGTASDSPTKMNVDDLYRAFEDVTKRVSQLESTIEGLKCAEREKHLENNDRLARLELLIKEVLQGVQHFNESQKLDGATSKVRQLKVANVKDTADEEKSTESGRHPDAPHAHVESGASSEQMTQRFPGHLRPLHYSEAPPDPQNHSASYNTLPPQARMNEPGKSAAPQPPFPSHRPPDSMLLPPHHSMQVPPFPNQVQVLPLLPPPSSAAPPPSPPPVGFSNPSMEGNSYGRVQPPSNSYLEFCSILPYSSPQNGSSGPHVHEVAASGMVKPTSGFIPPHMQSWESELSSSPLSTHETTSVPGYSPRPPHSASHPVISAASGGGDSYPRFANTQSFYSASPISYGMPVDAVSASRNNQIVTDTVMAFGFSRQQVTAVVQELTDMGRPVDMNAVLDKIMKRGEPRESQRGRYGQRWPSN